MNEYWDELQAKICRKCIDGDGRGNCRLESVEECPLRIHLPQIVSTIANVKSNSYMSYVSALRRNVCILCDWQQPDGTCGRRINFECALDRYFPLVVDIVEYVRERAAV